MDHITFYQIQVEGQHKSLVAKKFFNKKTHADYTKSLSDKNRKDENEQLKIGHYQKRVRRQTVGTRIMKKVNDTNRTETTSQKVGPLYNLGTDNECL